MFICTERHLFQELIHIIMAFGKSAGWAWKLWTRKRSIMYLKSEKSCLLCNSLYTTEVSPWFYSGFHLIGSGLPQVEDNQFYPSLPTRTLLSSKISSWKHPEWCWPCIIHQDKINHHKCILSYIHTYTYITWLVKLCEIVLD